MIQHKSVQTIEYVPIITAEKITVLEKEEKEDDPEFPCCIPCWYLFLALLFLLFLHFFQHVF